jgi:hypothetical protein
MKREGHTHPQHQIQQIKDNAHKFFLPKSKQRIFFFSFQVTPMYSIFQRTAFVCLYTRWRSQWHQFNMKQNNTDVLNDQRQCIQLTSAHGPLLSGYVTDAMAARWHLQGKGKSI